MQFILLKGKAGPQIIKGLAGNGNGFGFYSEHSRNHWRTLTEGIDEEIRLEER